jgi:hypothetical protein
MTNVHCNKVTIACSARGSLPLLARSGQHAGATRIGVKQQPSWWRIRAAGTRKRCRSLPDAGFSFVRYWAPGDWLLLVSICGSKEELGRGPASDSCGR